MINPEKLTDDELLSRLEEFVEKERELLHEFLACLAEVDRRGFLEKRGYSSTFDYCFRRLKLSESEAYRRIQAARAANIRPQILSAVGEGRLTLSAVSLIAPHVRRNDAPELIARAEGKSTRQVEAIVAPLSPVPPKRDFVREVVVATPFQEENRVHFSFYGSRTLRAAIDRAAQLLSHKHPFGAMEDVLLDIAVDWLMRHDPLAACADRKPAAPGGGSIPAAVRRGVWSRDAGRCVFIGPGGVRCESRKFLELDHIIPRALGGADVIGNLRLLCRAHNDSERRRILGEGTGPTSEGRPGTS